MASTTNGILGVIGVGFGPSNLGLAIALEEHNENVARWRVVQKKQAEEAAKAAAEAAAEGGPVTGTTSQ